MHQCGLRAAAKGRSSWQPTAPWSQPAAPWMPVKAVDDGLLEIDGGLDGADGDEQHPHDGANEACRGDEVLELVLEVLPGRIAAWSAPRAASILLEKWN